MKWLSRTEEMILLVVRALGSEAYGLAIRDHLKKVTGKRYSVGAVYVPLERLEGKGLLAAHESEPTPERGGRSKRFYRLTPDGVEALAEVKQLHDQLWSGYNAAPGAETP